MNLNRLFVRLPVVSAWVIAVGLIAPGCGGDTGAHAGDAAPADGDAAAEVETGADTQVLIDTSDTADTAGADDVGANTDAADSAVLDADTSPQGLVCDPTPGVSAAIDAALEVFDGRTGNHEAIVLITDGEDHSGRGTEAAAHAEAGDFDKAIEFQKKALSFPDFQQADGGSLDEEV